MPGTHAPRKTPIVVQEEGVPQALQEESVPRLDPIAMREALMGEGVPTEEEAQMLAEQAADPELRMERVDAIRAALARGNYSVSSEGVAAKLVTYLREK